MSPKRQPAAKRRAPRTPAPLGAYRAKRDFTRSREPRGRSRAATGDRFVIQKHDASRLHYDFRLEVDGVLKSWAVPKGVPMKRSVKHLAVQVEDHPIEYLQFEGIIPKGQYGGGTVMVWDTGTYHSLGATPRADLEAGKLHFELHGRKLNGEWTLVHTPRLGEENWLLIKSGADAPPISKKRDSESAISERGMTRIAHEPDAEWRSDHEEPLAPLKFITPMKATPVAEPPAHGDWSYELKFDGYRALALKTGGRVKLLSRNAKDFAKRFPDIVKAISRLPAEAAVLDGEIVALDEDGRSSFQLLQALELHQQRPALAYYIFDLLHCDGADLTGQPLGERRRRLSALLHDARDPIRESAEIKGDPKKLLAEVRKRGLEGLIGKRRDSLYEPGRRSPSWIKLKCVFEQEMVIGGYTPPDGSRKYFGALLVGYYKGKSLHFAGKVGTGFNAALLKTLHAAMDKHRQHDCPFSNLPDAAQGRHGGNLTPAAMKRCTWIAPALVCQVRFTEWTQDDRLRHPSFLGLREDKEPAEVIREIPRRS